MSFNVQLSLFIYLRNKMLLGKHFKILLGQFFKTIIIIALNKKKM